LADVGTHQAGDNSGEQYGEAANDDPDLHVSSLSSANTSSNPPAASTYYPAKASPGSPQKAE
jgi:hypothetical protein